MDETSKCTPRKNKKQTEKDMKKMMNEPRYCTPKNIHQTKLLGFLNP